MLETVDERANCVKPEAPRVTLYKRDLGPNFANVGGEDMLIRAGCVSAASAA